MSKGSKGGWSWLLFGSFDAGIERVVGSLDRNPPTPEGGWISKKVLLALCVSDGHNIRTVERGWDGKREGKVSTEGIDGGGGDHLSLCLAVSLKTVDHTRVAGWRNGRRSNAFTAVAVPSSHGEWRVTRHPTDRAYRSHSTV